MVSPYYQWQSKLWDNIYLVCEAAWAECSEAIIIIISLFLYSTYTNHALSAEHSNNHEDITLHTHNVIIIIMQSITVVPAISTKCKNMPKMCTYEGFRIRGMTFKKKILSLIERVCKHLWNAWSIRQRHSKCSCHAILLNSNLSIKHSLTNCLSI